MTSFRIASVVSRDNQLFHKALPLSFIWKRSPIFRLLRIFFLAAVIGSPGRADPAEFLLCDLELQLPEGLRLRQESDGLSEFDSTYAAAGRASWLFSCAPNQRRTSRISEIETGGNDLNERVRNLETFFIDQEVEAVLYERTRIIEGRRIYSIESYLATRNIEYRILVVPGGSGGLSLAELRRYPIEGIRAELRTMLDRARFQGTVEQTITEAEFARRLRLLITGAGAIAVLISAGLVWRWRRRAQRRAAARAVSRSS